MFPEMKPFVTPSRADKSGGLFSLSGLRIRRKASHAGKRRKTKRLSAAGRRRTVTRCILQHIKPLPQGRQRRRPIMAFFNSAITVLQTLVIALGAGLGIWGAINLLEGYGNDNPGAKSQGMKQLMAGGGVALIGTTLVPLLSGLFG
jgi:hypothetical protein